MFWIISLFLKKTQYAKDKSKYLEKKTPKTITLIHISQYKRYKQNLQHKSWRFW